MTPVTEAQKKQIIILLTVFLTLIIYIRGIRPMQANIESNTTKLAEVEAKRQEMQILVDNRTIEPEYVKLREEYETKFQLRFASFNINERVEAVAKENDITITSIKIQDFLPIKPNIYENHIAQPKTMEELEQVKQDEKSMAFPLLLSSKVDLTLEIDNLEDELRMYDAFNNIIPVGPGDADGDRYCLLVPTMSLNNLSKSAQSPWGGRTSIAYTVYVFAMETMDLATWDAELEARKQGGTS